MVKRQIALANDIFSVIAGSHGFGLNTDGSDEDYKGAFIAPPDLVLGLHTFDEYRDEPMHFASFRKWGNMLASSKPNYVEFLFVPDYLVKKRSKYFQPLLDNREAFLTKAFVSQYTDMAKGLSRRSSKPQLNAQSDAFKLQCKQSQHGLRIALTLQEFVETGTFNVFRAHDRDALLAVKFGQRDLLEVDVQVKEITDKIDLWVLDSDMPSNVDDAWVHNVVVNGTKQYWRDNKWL